MVHITQRRCCFALAIRLPRQFRQRTMKKNSRSGIAAETVTIVNNGCYQSPRGRTVSLRTAVEAAVGATRLYDAATFHPAPTAERAAPARITVTAESTLEALERLAKLPGGHLGCLNFASAKNPGGGFLNGAQAQEESLARSSALYACLLNAPSYYERNRANQSTIYLELAIYSPAVPFFRRDDGQLLEDPVLASVITCPAPNAGAVERNEPQRVPDIVPALARRASFVLDIARTEGVKRLVLGAWGCGVFRNDPTTVAEVFARLLKQPGEFAAAFDEVVFAVFDNSTSKNVLKSFESVLG